MMFFTRTWVRSYENRKESKMTTTPKAHPPNKDGRPQKLTP